MFIFNYFMTLLVMLLAIYGISIIVSIYSVVWLFSRADIIKVVLESRDEDSSDITEKMIAVFIANFVNVCNTDYVPVMIMLLPYYTFKSSLNAKKQILAEYNIK